MITDVISKKQQKIDLEQMKPKILLDVDGILTDFHQHVANFATSLGFPITTDQIQTWDISVALKLMKAPESIIEVCLNYIASEGFNLSLKPEQEAVDKLPKIKEVANVVLVTTPNINCESWIQERKIWLKRYFNIEPNEVVFSHQKDNIQGDIFIDDNPYNVRRWSSSHPYKTSLLWNRPYNKHSKIERINSWDELYNLVKVTKKNFATCGFFFTLKNWWLSIFHHREFVVIFFIFEQMIHSDGQSCFDSFGVIL